MTGLDAKVPCSVFQLKNPRSVLYSVYESEISMSEIQLAFCNGRHT